MSKVKVGSMVSYHTTEEERNVAHRNGNAQSTLAAVVISVIEKAEVPAVEANVEAGIEAKEAIPASVSASLRVFCDGNPSGDFTKRDVVEGTSEGEFETLG